MTARVRRSAGVLVLLVLVVTACSGGDGDDDGGGGPARDGDPAVDEATADQVDRWEAMREDPCGLLDPELVGSTLGWSGATTAPDEALEATCRYADGADGTRVATVEVLRRQSEASLAARTAGTVEDDGGHRLRLDSPGVGTIVAADGAAAVVAIRDPQVDLEALAPAIVALGGEALEALAPVPLVDDDATDDPCAAVPPDALDETDATGGDAGDPAFCAYRLPDGTLLRFGTRPEGAVDLASAGVALEGSVDGARVVEVPGDAGGAVRALAPVEGGIAEVAVTSPARAIADQRELATTVLGALADG